MDVSTGKAPRIDLGRVFMVPLFALMTIPHMKGTYCELMSLFSVGELMLGLLCHNLLLLLFYVLLTFVYLVRSSPRGGVASFTANLIAVGTTFLPFVILFFDNPPQKNPTIISVGNLIAISGMVLSLFSLFMLGKNMSIIPQARELVRKGPYRLVRHPLYLGECITIVGLVMTNLTIQKAGAVFVLLMCQVYRATEEEKLLADNFPEYGEYSKNTARFLPGIY